MTEGQAQNISVSKGLLIGVLAVAVAALLALAFVLGRESGSGSVPAPAAKIERIAPRAKEEPLPLPTPPAAPIAERSDWRPVSGPAPSAPEQGAAPQAAAGQAAAPVESGGSNAGSDPERAAVAAYFDTIERIHVGVMSGEAEAVAHEMAAALASGDTTSLDKMIRDTEAAKERLAAVAPPAPCATHHRESLGSLDDALDVLGSLKAAMESAEPVGRLAELSTRAMALRSRAEVLEKEELALRERYGLKR